MRKFLLADDHHIVRNGLRQIILTECSDAVFGEAENAAAVLKKIREDNWDLLILDMEMPGRNGLDVLKQLKDEKIITPVLIFSMHAEAEIAVRALRSGAAGYLNKQTVDTELCNAIRLILTGRKYITPQVAELLASEIENPTNKPPHQLLSDREYQTLLLIASGKTISIVADELALSVTTVSTYRARILEKMNMKTNAELTNYVLKNNLIQL